MHCWGGILGVFQWLVHGEEDDISVPKIRSEIGKFSVDDIREEGGGEGLLRR